MNLFGVVVGDIDEMNMFIIVIDGVFIVGGNFVEFNFDDIESINILKDVVVVFIYGFLGVNGVVLIIIKKGLVGEVCISFNLFIGFVDVVNCIDMMNVDEFIQYCMDFEIQGGILDFLINVLVDFNELCNYIVGNEVDWQDVFL